MRKPAKLIRVTSVLSWVESAWKEFWWRKVGFEAADKITKESAEFGTRVHKIVEGILKGTTAVDPESQVPEDQCAIAIIFYLEQHQITPLFETYDKSLEIEVKDEKLGLVGHFDYAAKVDGKPCIVDFKTTNKMRKSFPLQKAAYAILAENQMGIKIDDGLTIRSHWDKEAQKVEFEEKKYENLTKKYWPVFKMCLTIYKYFNRTEKV